MPAQPVRDCIGGAVFEQIDRLTASHIDDDRAVDTSSADGEVVDTDGWHHAHLWQRDCSDQPQQPEPRHFGGEVAGPVTGPAAQCQPDHG
jgi:hypothetical protein